MKKIIFIGGIFTSQIEKWVNMNSKGVIQYAADTLQKCFLEGLAFNTKDLKIFNLPYIGSYPTLCKRIFFNIANDRLEIRKKFLECHNISFCNIALIKNYSRYVNLKRALIKHLKKEQNNEIVLIVYAAHSPFLKAIQEIKKDFPGIKVVLIVPDLPQFMSSSKGFLRKIAQKINNRICESLYDSVDGFVLLTASMCERINMKNRLFVVIEGIFSSANLELNITTDLLSIQELNEKSLKYIVYTGTLAKRYGVINLVEAFKQIKRDDLRLLIIGGGDSENIIIDESIKDKRIIYKGQLSHEIVLKIQSQAFLLVNPRTSKDEYTKYSFPSKTMEYLASGTPTLINKLPGIPQEYYSYCFQPKDESINSLKETIEYILSLPIKELEKKAIEARNFIIENKNPQAQCSKLIDLISKL